MGVFGHVRSTGEGLLAFGAPGRFLFLGLVFALVSVPLSGRGWYDWGMTICPACDTRLPVVPGRGRPRKYCGEACRSRYRRATALPKVMTERRAWVRADGKRPIRPCGRPASSTDPSTWAMFEDVQTGAGDGFGFMLGSGIGAYDLDGVTDDQVREFVAAVGDPVLFVERSLSGRGAHVFIRAPEGPGWKRTINGMSVERYTRGRFIRMTGIALNF